MLYYIYCINKDGFKTFYLGNDNPSIKEWRSTPVLKQPTFINVFKAKHLIDGLKKMDIENSENNIYTYSILPVLTFTRNNNAKICTKTNK